MDNDIDMKIRQALSRDEVQVFDEFAKEQSLLDQAIQLMTGRNRLINILMVFVTVLFMMGCVGCVWQFSQAETTKELIGWALGIVLSMMMVSMFKLWAWMEIEKNCTIREIKRLELQVAHLGRKLNADAGRE